MILQEYPKARIRGKENLTTTAFNGAYLLSKLEVAHDSVQSSLMYNYELVRPFVMCDGSNHG